MGVNTTADEKIDKAEELAKEIKEKISEMIILFEDAMDGETWGSGQYKEEYLNKIDQFISDSNNYKRVISKFFKKLNFTV